MVPLLFPITYKCNLECANCTMKDSEPEPDIDICLGLIENLKNIEWVYITGGEPLMVENLEEICNTIRSFGKKIAISTNGTIENDRIHLFADRVGVSIDGTPGWHDKYRGKGNYKKALDFLKGIIGKVETVLMFTKYPENEHCEEFIRELGKEINVDNLQISKGI